MWWVLGIGIFVSLGLKASMAHQMLIAKSIENLSAKIQRLRELARKGDKQAVQHLKNLDQVLAPLETAQDRDSAKIFTALKYDNLYPPSSL